MEHADAQIYVILAVFQMERSFVMIVLALEPTKKLSWIHHWDYVNACQISSIIVKLRIVMVFNLH